MSLPPLDICKLEATEFVSEVDINQVWQVVCKLYGETDNVRVTGQRNFDTRYLNYQQKSGQREYDFFDHNEKVKGDWRAHFLTRTAQILLHSSDPAFLPINVEHGDRCECSLPKIPEQPVPECDCWGEGIDPTHHAVLLRLMAVPPQSNIAKCFLDQSQRDAHFSDVEDAYTKRRLLVPFRYAEYFAEGFKTRALDLLDMLIRECRFQPRLLPIHCEFMYHSELFQLYLSGTDQAHHNAHALFVEFLSNVEQLEFYWMGGLKGDYGDGKSNNPSMCIPKVVLEAILVSQAPKLDTLSFRVYSSQSTFTPYYLPMLDGFLEDIAPFFSAIHAKNSRNEFLPISTPYSGLKRLHIFGNIVQQSHADIISSIILYQSAIEGLEIMCKSREISPSYLLDPIVSIFSQPQFQYLAFNRWLECDLKEIFQQFIDSNCTCEVRAISTGHEVVIPARSKNSAPPSRKHLCFYTGVGNLSYLGILFEWLREARLNVPLLSITLRMPLGRKMDEHFVHYLDSCHALTINFKRSKVLPDAYLEALSRNPNLTSLRLHNCSFNVEMFCEILRNIYTNCANLTELSLQNNKLNVLSPKMLNSFFEAILSYPHLEQLSLDLRYNNLKDEDVDVLVKVWRGTEHVQKCLESLTLDSEQQQEKVEELIV